MEAARKTKGSWEGGRREAWVVAVFWGIERGDKGRSSQLPTVVRIKAIRRFFNK